jgi:hypothetical protein
MAKFNPFRYFFSSVLVFAALNLTVILGAIFGPYLEGKFLPVTVNVMSTVVAETPEYIQVAVTGEKVRACQLLEIRILVDEDNNTSTPPIKGSIRVINDGAKDASSIRALGSQHFGIWEIRPNGHRGVIDASYRCHALWKTETRLGSWKSPDGTALAPLGFTLQVN